MSEYLRKHALECLRLAADCAELARGSENPAMQAHFARMADVWSGEAMNGPAEDQKPN
jgi:hypothetical protein